MLLYYYPPNANYFTFGSFSKLLFYEKLLDGVDFFSYDEFPPTIYEFYD